jgi:phosphoglucomutase
MVSTLPAMKAARMTSSPNRCATAARAMSSSIAPRTRIWAVVCWRRSRTAVTGLTPSQQYAKLEGRFGSSVYERIDAPATVEQKSRLGKLSADAVTASSLAGEPITAILTHAPGNGAALGGLKVETENAWFAARPSGTENVYKIYGESFKGVDHLRQVQQEAKALVDSVLG